MRAITISSFGDPEGLSVTDVGQPEPASDQVLIAVEAIGVGGVDAVIRRGTLGGSGVVVGDIPGSEVAGRVVAVGAGVDPSWIGRRVWAFTGLRGGYAEFAVAAIDDVTALPDALSSPDSVTLGSAATVAHFALEHSRFSVGERVLIRGASGSIGLAAVELARERGAGAIVVTTSSADRDARLAALGATSVLDRAGNDSGEVDVIIDIVGGEAIPSFIDKLAPNGRMVLVGAVGGYPPADFGMSLMRSFQRSLSFSTFSLNTVPIETRNRVRAELFDVAVAGRLTAHVHALLPLADAADAHRAMDRGEVLGRIVLTP